MEKYSGYSSYAQKWVERVRNGQHLSHRFYEKPAMYNKLPVLINKNVLCIGCGTGEECDYIMKLGAKKVIGIDVVKEMIDIAKESYTDIEFQVMDMREINFGEESFDFAYSSLALHYVNDWVPVLTAIHKSLKKDGIFLFSTHHFYLGASEVITKTMESGNSFTSSLLGYEEDNDKHQLKIYGDYLTERKITQTWFGDLKVDFHHKTLQTMVHEILQSGFEIKDIIEPKPQEEMKKFDSNSFQILNTIPYFLIFEIKKV